MRNVKRIVLIPVVCFFLSVVAGGQTDKEDIVCTVRVVDVNAQPVVGAEVAACEGLYYYS